MSEGFFLNTVFGGNKDKVFETLCRDFSKETDCYKKTKILHSLVQTYLTFYKDEMETSIKTTEFLELLSELPVLCNKFLQTSISEDCFLNEVKPANNFENKSENLESASLCFDDVLACVEAFRATKKCLVVAKISLNILFQGYTHCKESEAIYGNLLEQFADQLGIFFKKIESLQVVVLQLLDGLSALEYFENDPYINCIVLEMGNLCQVVFSLDADIASELWASYMRIVTDHTSLKQISNINAVSLLLVLKNIEVLQHIQYNEDQNSEEVEELSAKLFFYLDALTSFTNLTHDSFKENISEFRTFVLHLLECLVSCYSAFVIGKTCLNIIKCSLVKNTFTLLSHFCTNEDFLKSLLILPDKNTHISCLLLKLCALQFIKNASLEFKIDFFKSVLTDCSSSNAKDDIIFLYTKFPKSTVTKVDSDETLTLYNFAYEQITDFSKLLPDSVIEEMENIILEYLVSSSDVIYLLISDIWMFRLRYSCIEFFKDRCYSVLQYISRKNLNNDKIENFVKRMLRFLPFSYKDRLLREFVNVKFIHDNEDIQHAYGVPYSTSTVDEVFICSEDAINTRIGKLIEEYNNDPSQLIQKSCMSLELCILFLDVSDCSDIVQFLEFSAELFKTHVYEIQIAVLTFIKALSRKTLPEHDQEFENIVLLLSQLFSEAMHSKNYIVRYEARNVFGYFAKCTPHVKIVQETVKRDPSLKHIMKSYINALPENNFLSEKEKGEYLKKQSLEMNTVKVEITKQITELLQQFFSKGNFKLLT